MSDERKLLRIVNSVAPIRICDNGGWSDTWFARYGRVFNIAVYPYAEVQMQVFAHAGARARITINAENYGLRYTIAEPQGNYDKHPLLEAAIDYMHIPADVATRFPSTAKRPALSHRHSAAVSVALIGALIASRPDADRARNRQRARSSRRSCSSSAASRPNVRLRRHQLHRHVRASARQRQPHPHTGFDLVDLAACSSTSACRTVLGNALMVIREPKTRACCGPLRCHRRAPKDAFAPEISRWPRHDRQQRGPAEPAPGPS
jgi:hypothetical protein